MEDHCLIRKALWVNGGRFDRERDIYIAREKKRERERDFIKYINLN